MAPHAPARFLLPLALTGAIAAQDRAPASVIDASLLGPHAVGFRAQVFTDRSREYRETEAAPPVPGGRPIPTYVWYPARHGRGTTMTVGDYVIPSGDLRAPGTRDALRRAAIGQLATNEAADPSIDALLPSRLHAVRDADNGVRGPLVLFAHTSPLGASVMAEYLASHGFVVAGFRSKGAAAGPYTLSIANLEGMAADLAFLARELASWPNVDATRVAVIGMSNGALGAVALEQQRPLRAIVSLDGTIGERVAAQALSRLTGFDEARATSPLLHLYTPENPNLDLSTLGAQPRAHCGLVRIERLRHRDFLAFAAFERVAPGLTSAAPATGGRAFDRICALTVEFLRGAFAGAPTIPPAPPDADALGLTVSACRSGL